MGNLSGSRFFSETLKNGQFTCRFEPKCPIGMDPSPLSPDHPPMSQHTFKRSKKLINPSFQLRLVGTFGGVALLAMLLQFSMLGYFLIQGVSELENGSQLASQVPGALVSSLLVSVAILAPLFLLVGVMLTFRIAGPLYRFEQYCLALGRGEKMGPCRIRKGDQLQSLCSALNLATASLQVRPESPEQARVEPELAETAAA